MPKLDPSKIRLYMMAPAVVSLVAILALALWGFNASHTDMLDAREDVSLERFRQVLAQDLNERTEILALMLELIQQNAPLAAAVSSGDVDSIAAEMAPLFERFKGKAEITQLCAISPDRKALFRAHDPELRGDPVDRRTLEECIATGRITTVIDLGVRSAPVLRAVAPLPGPPETRGFVMADVDIGDVLVRLSKDISTEFVLLLDKQMVTQDRWEAAQEEDLKIPPWDALPQHVIGRSSLDLSSEMIAKLAKGIDSNGDNIQRTSGLSRTLEFCGKIPLKDGAQSEVGQVLVYLNQSAYGAEWFKSILANFAAGAAIAVLLATGLFFYLGWIVAALNERSRAIVVKSAELEKSTLALRELAATLESKVEERTQMLSATVARLEEEITQREAAERGQAATEARYRAIVASEPECVKLVDRECRLLDMNPAGLRMVEAGALAEVQRHDVRDLLAPEYRELFGAGVEAVFRGETTMQEFEVIGLKGTRRWMQQHAGPLRDPANPGAVLSMLAVTRDVTGQRQAAAELKKERDFASGLVDTIPAIILMLDTEGRITFVNPYFEDLTGYLAAEVVGQGWFEMFLMQPDHPRVRELFQRALNGEATQGNVNPIRTRNGEHRQIQWYDRTLRDEDGRATGLLAIGLDVTAQWATERRLQDGQVLLQALMDATPDWIFVKDLEHRFLVVNQGFAAAQGRTPARWTTARSNDCCSIHGRGMCASCSMSLTMPSCSATKTPFESATCRRSFSKTRHRIWRFKPLGHRMNAPNWKRRSEMRAATVRARRNSWASAAPPSIGAWLNTESLDA